MMRSASPPSSLPPSLPPYLSLQDLEPDIGLAIQECLSFIAGAYRGVGPGQSALIVEALLLENIYSVSRVCRAMMCTSCFIPF